MTAQPHTFRRRASMLVLSVGLAAFAMPAATAAATSGTDGHHVAFASDGSAVKNVTTPYFVGTPKVGYTLSARPGRWDPATATVTYAWFDGARLLGTGPTYVVRPAELGHTLSITATATAAGRATASRSWASPSPVVRGSFWIKGAPTIVGRAKVGQRLSARSTATEPNGRRTYRWLRDGTPIGGATGSTYRVKKRDRRHRLTVRVTYTATAYDPASRTSRSTRRVRPM
jgi:hypothetical protein